MNYDYELECDVIYDLIVNYHYTIRLVEQYTGISRSTIHRRIKSMRFSYPQRYRKIRKVLDYNKEYRFKKRSLWRDVDKDLI